MVVVQIYSDRLMLPLLKYTTAEDWPHLGAPVWQPFLASLASCIQTSPLNPNRTSRRDLENLSLPSTERNEGSHRNAIAVSDSRIDVKRKAFAFQVMHQRTVALQHSSTLTCGHCIVPGSNYHAGSYALQVAAVHLRGHERHLQGGHNRLAFGLQTRHGAAPINSHLCRNNTRLQLQENSGQAFSSLPPAQFSRVCHPFPACHRSLVARGTF